MGASLLVIITLAMVQAFCKLHSVHSRLGEAHKFWHDMLASYQDPENFRVGLNAAIQALRNITFVLQNHKSLIPNFDAWYEKYRERMKNDDILNWLHQARNIIVKQQDLELHSIAVAMVRTWDDISLLKFEISPFITTEQLAKDLVRLYFIEMPKVITDHAVLNVERRWVVNNLPKQELLDVVAHGYNFLKNLVCDAHSYAGLNLEICLVQYKAQHDNSLIPCMSITRDDRSANIKLSNQEVLSKTEFTDFGNQPTRPEFQEKLRKYKNLQPALPSHIGDLFEFVKLINERAKQMLVLDRTHATVFLICGQDGTWNTLGMQAENQSEKFVLVRSVADQVKRVRATGVIAISEVWMITQDEARENELPAENPNRKEALQVAAVNANKTLSLMTLFERDNNGNIKLGETQEVIGRSFKLMQPIVDALRSAN